MSQKKLKKLRKEEKNGMEKEVVKVIGLKQIIKQNWKFLVFLLLGIIGLYFNSLRGDFVSDDYATIPQNQNILSFKDGLKGWMGGIINWFLATLFGIKSSIPFHIFSLTLYLLVLVALFVFVSLVLDQKLAKITAILFAVLPIHVETVSWIAGRPYLINALFVLSSLIFLVSFLKTGKKKYLYWLLVFIPLSFFAEKTRFAALPLLAVLYWFSFDNLFKKKINLGKILIVFGSVFLVAVIFIWPALLSRIEAVNSGINATDSIFYNPFFQYPTAISKYLQLIWFPVDLTLYHTMYIIPVWLNWLIFLTFLALIGVNFFKDKKMFFVLSFIFLASAPSMAPVKISWLVAERYVFLGSLGWCMFLAIILEKINNKSKILSMMLLILMVAIYGVRVFIRNIDWQTNHNLWVNSCQVSPNSHNAWNNIGDDYDKLAQLETTNEGKLKQYLNAIKGFSQSTVIKQNYADAYHNRGNIFYKIGRLDLAADSYKTALYYNPSMEPTYFSLIQINLIQEKYDSALEELESLKKIAPTDVQVWYVESYIDVKMGEVEKAKSILQAIVNQFPNYTDAVNLLKSISK